MPYPGLIKNRCGVYCYRLVFPLVLRQLGAPNEIRLSLGTKSRENLKLRWLHATNICTLLLSELSIAAQATDLTEFNNSLGTLKERIRLTRLKIRLDEQLAAKDDQLFEIRREALRLRQELAEQQAQTQAAQAHVQQVKTSAHGLIRAAHTMGQRDEARRTAQQPPHAQLVATRTIEATPSPAVRGKSLAELIALYLEWRERVKKVGANTLRNDQNLLARFLDIVGDLGSATLRKADVADYRSAIWVLPENLTKKPIWQTRPVDPLLRRGWYLRLGEHGYARLKEASQNTHFKSVGPFLKWLDKEGYAAEDHSVMLDAVKNDASYVEGGQPLDPAQLRQLVEGYLRPTGKLSSYEQPKDWHFWSLLLGLTTGMRVGEIAALTVDHVWEVGGIPMLHVPGTKTKNAKRKFPLPKTALDAGFMQLVNWRRRTDGSGARLFPDWIATGSKDPKTRTHSNTMHNWFGRKKLPDGSFGGMVVKLGIWREDHPVSFHDTRHTFMTSAYHSRVKLEPLQAIVGHGLDLYKTYDLPAPKDLGASAVYIKLGIDHSTDMQAACADLRNTIDQVELSCELTGLDWLAWRKAKGMPAPYLGDHVAPGND